MRREALPSPVTVSSPRQTTRGRLARILTEIFAPAPVATILLFVVAWQSTQSVGRALAWGGIAALFATLFPLLYLIRGVRRRQFTDHHVRLREQRPHVFLVGIVSLLVGLVLMAVSGAPRELVALVAAMGVGLMISLLVTLRWKISVHAAVAAGGIVILTLVCGLVLLALSPIVVLVGWARVAVGDHTPAQVAVGATIGTIVAASVFELLR